MKLVLQIGVHDGNDTVTYQTVTQFPCSIGRGFTNDIILPDPHISARHAEIHHNGTTWMLHDLGSENGVQLNGQPLKDGQAELKSGDALVIGCTPVMIFDPHHAVAPTQKLERTSPLIAHLGRLSPPWIYFIFALAAIGLLDNITAWSENALSQFYKVAGSLALGIFLWALPWAVASRLIRHKSNFNIHIGIASLSILALAIFWPLQDMLDFLTNESWVSAAAGYSFNFLVTIAMIYASLSVATHMPARRRMKTAIYFTLGTFVTYFLMYSIGDDVFIPQAEYATALNPFLQNLPQGVDTDTFMAENLKLFESSDLHAAYLPPPRGQ